MASNDKIFGKYSFTEEELTFGYDDSSELDTLLWLDCILADFTKVTDLDCVDCLKRFFIWKKIPLVSLLPEKARTKKYYNSLCFSKFDKIATSHPVVNESMEILYNYYNDPNQFAAMIKSENGSLIPKDSIGPSMLNDERLMLQFTDEMSPFDEARIPAKLNLELHQKYILINANNVVFFKSVLDDPIAAVELLNWTIDNTLPFRATASMVKLFKRFNLVERLLEKGVNPRLCKDDISLRKVYENLSKMKPYNNNYCEFPILPMCPEKEHIIIDLLANNHTVFLEVLYYYDFVGKFEALEGLFEFISTYEMAFNVGSVIFANQLNGIKQVRINALSHLYRFIDKEKLISENWYDEQDFIDLHVKRAKSAAN